MFEMWRFCQVEGVRRIWNTALVVEHLASMHEANSTVLCSGSSVCAVSMICSHIYPGPTKMPENATDPHGV